MNSGLTEEDIVKNGYRIYTELTVPPSKRGGDLATRGLSSQ